MLIATSTAHPISAKTFSPFLTYLSFIYQIQRTCSHFEVFWQDYLFFLESLHERSYYHWEKALYPLQVLSQSISLRWNSFISLTLNPWGSNQIKNQIHFISGTECPIDLKPGCRFKFVPCLETYPKQLIIFGHSGTLQILFSPRVP